MSENNTSENKFADVPIRVRTWVYIIVVFALSLINPTTMKIFVSWIGFQCSFEFLRMFEIKKNRILISSIVGIGILFNLYLLDITQYFLASTTFIFVMMIYFLIIKSSKKQLLGVLLALIICLFSFPQIAMIRELSSGIAITIFLAVVTELNDVFQYLMGKFFGKHKIVPKISPNKTVEGFLGGILLTTILSSILGNFLLETKLTTNILIGISLGISGFVGDVFMSYIKRNCSVKDTGNLLPGHGGLLDRMDSLIFNAPLFLAILLMLTKN